LARSPATCRLNTIYSFGEEDLLLNFRREQRQVEDLGDPRSREAESPGSVGADLEPLWPTRRRGRSNLNSPGRRVRYVVEKGARMNVIKGEIAAVVQE
jgi:hypothetical protein